MNYTTDIVNVETLDNARRQISGSKFTLDADGNRGWVDVVAFDADSMTGLAVYNSTGQIFPFRVTGRSVQRGVVRVALFAFTDLSLSAGTLTALGSDRINGGTVNAAFFVTPNAVEASF